MAAQCSKTCSKACSKTDVYKDWKLGVQTWSFRKFTLFEAIDKTRALGLDSIQAFPGQQVSKESDIKFGHELTADQRQQLKAKLKEASMSIAAFGVVGIPDNEADARKLYEFAKQMGIGILVSEPQPEQFDLIDKLCQEYKIKLAIHNHPKPSYYWNPDTVLEVCEGRSKWIGACADVGHWVRCGFDPVDCLKKLEGRIHDVHVKEVDDKGDNRIFGDAQNHVEDVLKELHRQKYKGTFAIEYESNWDNNLPDIQKCVLYFNSVASQLACNK
jgi:sugar phosphate isomerase/epimerase